MSCFLVLLLLVLSSAVVLGSFSPTAAATSNTNNSSSSIAKPNCSDHCGNVSIPFPFGLTKKCALNSNFSITCDTSLHPPKPFITNSAVEVRDISLEGQLNVKKGIARKCYTPRTDIPVFELKSEPTPANFYVNQTANKFVAVGCNAFAVVTENYLADDDEEEVDDVGSNKVEGCITSSGGRMKDVKNGTCGGDGCCEIGISNVARDARVLLDTTTDSYPDKHCIYAFVVQKEEFNFSAATMLAGKWDVNKLPVVLDWILPDQTCNAICQGNTICVSVNVSANSKEGYRCGCKVGYEGNPYLSPGCQDIDECVNRQNNCFINSICSNIEGSYECHCKEGYHGDGKGESVCQLPKDDCKDNGKGCTSSSKRMIIEHVIGIALCTVLLISGFCLYLGYRKRKSTHIREKFFRENGGLILKQKIAQGTTSSGTTRIFTAQELKKATNNYDQTRIIGQGGFGVVYKGHLLDGRMVAVKKPKMLDPTQVEQFINEVIVLSQINHRNIVKLFGCCLEIEVPLLVYEFINNGTLSDHLNDKDKASTLVWPIRLRIATETAEVLSYLHSAAFPPIIHRDVKPANILLDNEYIAKVSDFGASRLVLQDQTQLITMVQGTFGYLDPEYMQTHELTEKSDVYSFGVVLMELLTGRRAVLYDGPVEERSLYEHFISSLKINQLFKILDDNIVCEGNTEELQEVALLARRCLNVKGEEKPTMKEVAVELSGLRRAAKHSWVNNNSDTSIKSHALFTEPLPIPSGYIDATFSITTSEYDSLKHHMELPMTTAR
ncbi:PREDICTED: wall-associated receptor kinase 2-like [Ipomoea nil]|uniref:wall-associated receptor kinase 2-like n=1 Tax=Ipomoea nil TaxID=35883 RepID=UPI0009011A6B|nr:PREDICTED: wall-associated receptor kinase 2-like [Ipomoea nil]